MSEQGRPGRYNRSANGLIASMVVVVLAVVAFVGFRALFSDDATVKPQRLDYLQTVSELQRSGFDPVYPTSLPEGWIATNVDYTPGTPPQWGLSLLTDQDHYVGIQESSMDAGQLLDRFVDRDVTAQDALSTPGGLASRWDGWSDSGGDHAFTAEAEGRTVLVFGSAPLGDIEEVVRSLSTTSIRTATPTATPPAPGSPTTR